MGPLLWLFLAPSAQAITVCNAGCDFKTLLDAVAAAVDGDVITVGSGKYGGFTVSGLDLTIRQDPGDPGAEIGQGGAATVVTVDGGSNVAFDGIYWSGDGRCLAVTGTSTADVVNSRLSDCDPNTDGGAIWVDVGSTVTITDSQLDLNGRNTRDAGAALVEGTLAATRVVFTGNAGAKGAAVLVTGSLGSASFYGCTFTGNDADDSGGAIAVRLQAAIEVRGSAFDGNTAVVDGGAIDVSDLSSSALLADSTFLNGSADGDGGAVHCKGGARVDARRVRACSNHAGGDGGAMKLELGTQFLSDVLLAENDATGLGGGVLLDGTAATVLNTSFLSNDAVAANNGALYVTAAAGAATVDVRNSLFYLDVQSGLYATGGAVVTEAYDAWNGNTGSALVGVAGPGADDILAAPGLVDWVADGDCLAHSPSPDVGSPLIDAGDPAIPDADDCGRSDIGAFRGPDMDATGTDGDGDGLDWATEIGLGTDSCASDTDTDGLDDPDELALGTDPLDADTDDDGVADGAEMGPGPSLIDTDRDGVDDAFDPDDDGDTVLTADEDRNFDGDPTDDDQDGDGIADYLDDDDDGDGWAALQEDLNGNGDPGDDDLDGDGHPDFLDSDDDGDGIPTSEEVDQGGLPLVDGDPDGDGLLDSAEWDPGKPDSDGDGLDDFVDPDDDGDGLDTLVEGPADVDGDGAPNYLDADSDGDGRLDAVEGTGDDDHDTIANFLDPDDSDGVSGDPDLDGLITADELAIGSNPSDPDTDGDGVPDGQESTGDRDGDGTLDAFDLDDDGDGLPTSAELGAPCEVVDLVANLLADELQWVCSDDTTVPVAPRDTDGDGAFDWEDPDDDGDGAATADEDRNGDGDWTDDDLDGDAIADWLDGDDFDGPTGDPDRDGLTSDVEAQDGCTDPLLPDTDHDGRTDAEELGDPSAPTDTDADGAIDPCDDDDDNDGISSFDEGWFDTDGDGLPDAVDGDSDGDGIGDAEEGLTDADCDGFPDRLDAIDDAGCTAPSDSAPGQVDTGGCAHAPGGSAGLLAGLVLSAARRPARPRRPGDPRSAGRGRPPAGR